MYNFQVYEKSIGVATDLKRFDIYQVVSQIDMLVRETQALDSPPVDTISLGESVNVVKIEGRRAKIDHPKIGWISIRDKSGTRDFLQKPILKEGYLTMKKRKGVLAKKQKRNDCY